MTEYLVTYHGMGSLDPSPGAPLRPAGQVAAGHPEPAVQIAGLSILEADSIGAVESALATNPVAGGRRPEVPQPGVRRPAGAPASRPGAG